MGSIPTWQAIHERTCRLAYERNTGELGSPGFTLQDKRELEVLTDGG